MEGLLPLVFRAIKKHKTRRQYRCLSSGATLLYDNTQGYDYYQHSTQKLGDNEEKIGYHRRYNSVTEFSNGFSSAPRVLTRSSSESPASKQLGNYRSPKLFSCFTGV